MRTDYRPGGATLTHSATANARKLAVAEERLQRAGINLSKATTDLQVARNLGYWGTIIEVTERRVESAKLVVDAAYRAMVALR